ncbi:MAG: 16S rRNA (uracil(1498)-N(3))-methyltransferase [Candidatus Delongbacteria bacterium]|nr:16S rRNA (uracil(1498)-N(3))-methyltransferase [Candidatus Delongbacteria bacterium]MCG2760277.1 16S rRNA (uracil(1498)-N(3))-methyltransferase [Candidatus Delongbacteria bacterium]
METFYANKEISIDGLIEIEDKNEVVHAFASLRMKPDEIVEIINGKGIRFKSRVIDCSKNKLTVLPIEEIISDSEYSEVKLSAAVSMLNKSSKMKLLIEKLTEIGICEFIPFVSERTAFPKMSADSLKPSMISALKQCGGNAEVKISDTISFKKLICLNGFSEKYFADINGESFHGKKVTGRVLAVVGPEGGLADSEINDLVSSGFKSIKLNKRILRAETAAIVTASKFLY